MTQRRGTSTNTLLDRLGMHMAGKLNDQVSGYRPYTPSDFQTLCRTLRVGDVLLIEGNERISGAIKYLTQSTWSHAALYVGDRLPKPEDDSEPHRLVEVNLGEGCVTAPLSKYACYNTRICRPRGLPTPEREAVADFMIARLGLKYDLRNIFDMARYFLPAPPVPIRWRRRMIAFGSGDPTRAICSSLIAQAFQSVRYPILPEVTRLKQIEGSGYIRREIYHIRHHSLFTPRDFDLSPWFEIVKPNLVEGFDPSALEWDDTTATDGNALAEASLGIG